MLTLLIGFIVAHVWHLGSVVAVVVSYNEYKSAPWAAFHGLFGWFYPLYRWISK